MAVSSYISITQNWQDIANNYSNVTVKCVVTTTGASWNGYQKPGTCWIDGTAYTFTSDIKQNATTVIFEKTLDIYHNNDGSKYLEASFTFESGISAGTINRSTNSTLTTIPRASDFEIGSGNQHFGTAIPITIKRASDSFIHTVWWRFNNEGDWVTVSENATTSSEILVPLELANTIPNTDYGVTEICVRTTTASGTRIGADVYKSVRVYVPKEAMPSFKFEVAGIDLFNKLYLQNKSSVKLTIKNAIGAYGSTIQSYSISGGGYSSNKDTVTFGPLGKIGDITFTAKVTDSRGRTLTKSLKITVTGYELPSISFDAYRCLSTGKRDDASGTYIYVKPDFSYSSITENGIKTKTCEVLQNGTVKYTNSDFYTGAGFIIGEGGISTGSVYEVKISITDNAGGTSRKSITIGVAKVAFNIRYDKDGVGFGKICDKSGEMQVDYVLKTFKEMYANGGIKTSLGGRDGYAIQFLAGNESCTHMVIGAGGATIIGGGDAAKTILDNAGMTGANSESMCIGNDANIRVYTNLQNGWSDAKQFVFNKNGNFEVPNQLKINEKYIKTGTSGGWELYEFGNGMKMSCLSLDFNIGGWEVWGSGYTTVNGIPNKPMPSSFFSSIKGGYIVTKSGIDYGHWWEHDGPWTPTQTPKFYMVRPNNPGVAASTVRVTIYVFGV